MVIDKKTTINSIEEKGEYVKVMTYSKTWQDMFYDRRREQRRNDGPIAGRMRARTKQAASKPPPKTFEGDSRTDDPLYYTNIRGTPPQPHIPRHSTGAIVKRRSTNLALQRSDRKLRKTRENIRKHITNDDRYRNDSGRLRARFCERIYMLGTPTPDGSLGRMHRPLPNRDWKTPKRLAEKKKENEIGRSKNWEMNKYWTTEELELEFNIVPGNDAHLRDEELDREDYLDMQAYKQRRTKFIDYIARTPDIKGVWEKVLKLDDAELAKLGRWVIGEVLELRAMDEEFAVMDERCVAIVSRVWSLIEEFRDP